MSPEDEHDLTVTVLTSCNVATLRNDAESVAVPYGMICDAALVLNGQTIDWVGPRAALPETFAKAPHEDLDGRLVTPGLIDCHTHLIHGGHRAAEFEMRQGGASYEDIARAGGGIMSTVTATREASLEALVQSALPRLDALIAEGVTTVEIKSGYGLDQDTELTMLRAARQLGALRPVTIKTSFLGAHAVPPEYHDRPDTYLSEVCLPTLRAAHGEGLVDAVDAFCEGIAFQPDQVSRVFDSAKALGLPVKLHAEQLSNLGGAKLAASYQALSADHVEYIDESGVQAMADAGTVVVLLPGAFYTLRETQTPPIDLFRKHCVPMALATDANPGSSPMTSLLLALNMGATLFGLTPEDALRGATQHAAQALGLSDRGVVAPGQRADLAVWDVETPAELAYRIGFNPLFKRIYGGQV